jgi:hypothetical protein
MKAIKPEELGALASEMQAEQVNKVVEKINRWLAVDAPVNGTRFVHAGMCGFAGATDPVRAEVLARFEAAGWDVKPGQASDSFLLFAVR